MSLNLPSDRYKRINISKYTPLYKIDIGCGIKCPPDFIGIDVHDNGQEILWDVTEGIPLPNDTVKEIRIYHFLEHIEYPKLDAFFRELRRICVKGAIIDIKVPYKEHPDSYALPHVSFWGVKDFEGLVKGFINSRKERLPILKIIFSKIEHERIVHIKLEVVL